MKRPPEFSWQDKAILFSLPVVVLVIFILTNYYTQDPTVSDAFESQLNQINVRDGGRIVKIYPQTASDTVALRLQTRTSPREFDFIYNKTASETFIPAIGEIIQFYGQYKYDKNGGSISVPYKGKSGQVEGWAIYRGGRFTGPKLPDTSKPLNQ